MKVRAAKLRFDRPTSVWIEQALSIDPRLELLPLSARIAVMAAELEWQHGDPADRLIIATARELGCPLLTSDKKILAYAAAGHVSVIDARL